MGTDTATDAGRLRMKNASERKRHRDTGPSDSASCRRDGLCSEGRERLFLAVNFAASEQQGITCEILRR